MSQSGSGHSNPDKGAYQPPLVIVSQDGRNTEASRRIVRAQAARASAAQSRVTRARNREEREGFQRDGFYSAFPSDPKLAERDPSRSSQPEQDSGFAQLPLSVWLGDVALLAASATIKQPVHSASRSRPIERGVSDPSTPSDGSGGPQWTTTSDAPRNVGPSGLRLPLATPKGFASLQQRIAVPDSLQYLLSRTACVDFASPGVEDRLLELLSDLIAYSAMSQPIHPVQNHLRVACTCLTIFQGQRANGGVFGNDRTYHDGLAAAWSEATMLDINALSEPKAAEVSLWAIFIISVTTGSKQDFFHKTLQALFEDLQLRYWEQVRKVLLDFIYPVSFLDEPSRTFHQNLQRLEIALS